MSIKKVLDKLKKSNVKDELELFFLFVSECEKFIDKKTMDKFANLHSLYFHRLYQSRSAITNEFKKEALLDYLKTISKRLEQ